MNMMPGMSKHHRPDLKGKKKRPKTAGNTEVTHQRQGEMLNPTNTTDAGHNKFRND